MARLMIDEEEDGDFREFATLLKADPKGLHGHKFSHHHSIRGKGLYNRHQSRDAGFYGQELACDEALGSNNVGYREGWHHGNINSFQPASDPSRANKGSNNIDLLPHKKNNGFPKIRRGHHFGLGVHDGGHNQRNSQIFGDRLHGHGHSRNYVGGRGRGGYAGNHTHGRGYYHRHVSNYKDAGSLNFHGEGRNLQPNSGGKQIKNKAFTHNYGKRGGRGHCFHGSYKRVGVRSGISKVFHSVDNKVNVFDSSPLDAGPTEKLECKNDGNVCSIQSPRATEEDGSVCMESEIQGVCPIQSPASNSCSKSLVLQRSELQKEGVPPRKDSMLDFGDQRHLERAFISCGGGSRKRRRSSAVRDFPVRSCRLQMSSVKVKKVIIKSKDRKSIVSRDLVLEDSVRAGSQSDLTVANEISSLSNRIIAPADCNHVGPKLTIEDCNKAHLGMVDGSSDIVRSDLETMSEIASKIIVDEGNTSAELTEVSPEKSDLETMSEIASKIIADDGNTSAELTEVSPEKIVENCSCLTLFKGNEQGPEMSKVMEMSEIEICSKTFLLEKGAGSEDSFGIIEAELPELNVQVLDRLDTQHFENSSQVPSLLTHVKVPEESDVATRVSMQTSSQASDVATRVSMQTSSQGNEHSRPKERKKNRRTDMQAVGGLLKSKSRPNKVFAALTGGLHNHCHVPKKARGQDSLELTKETGALIPYQSTDGGNTRNKDFGKRLIHKGSSRAKLFQTSKSFDPNDAAKLLTLEASEGVSDRTLVKRTLHEFESIRKALVKSQNAGKRADLDAGALLREKGKWRNCNEKIVGEVPGIEVGDQFSFRMEMLIIGLHRQVQSGIDYIPGTKRHNRSPLATSIVASGGYEDDKDDGNTLIYSGQGGNNIKGNKKQESNQELVRGNLALSNSMKERTPVRVIRGTTDLASPSSKVYTYDGLYDVVNYAFECGAAGFWVYQFTLTRRPGQPQVGLSFLSNLKKKGLSRPNLLLNDISRGQERLPVCVVNEVDEEPAPLHFSYIPSIKYPIWYSPLLPQGCQCFGVCDEETCSCAIKNGGEFQYNEKGYMVRDKKVVYECGPSCSCSSSCGNRVSQKGLRYRLEIFKTKNRGWGVRSLDSIQPGGFICEYTGELLSDAEAEQRVGNDEYLFDLGNECNPSVVQSDLADVNSTLAVAPVAEDVAYTIDAKDLGNVARFINHSCSPNLYAQNVLYDSDDLRFPHVMLIAMENIPPMRELTYDYHYSIDQVRDAQGNVKSKACYCGAQDCEGRLY